jgi:hypothetical protein
MNPLASRKQLLIAESELNRAQLVRELETIADQVHSFVDRAATVGSLASLSASLMIGLTCFRRGKTATAAGKPSWLQTILAGAQLARSLWTRFRSPCPGRDTD